MSVPDVSIQAQVLNRMTDLQADLGQSFLFVSHAMAVVERVSHHVAIMHLGRIVEVGPRPAIFEDPRHPWARSPMAAVPVADPRQRRLCEDPGFTPVPSPVSAVGQAQTRKAYRTVAPRHAVLVA